MSKSKSLFQRLWLPKALNSFVLKVLNHSLSLERHPIQGVFPLYTQWVGERILSPATLLLNTCTIHAIIQSVNHVAVAQGIKSDRYGSRASVKHQTSERSRWPLPWHDFWGHKHNELPQSFSFSKSVDHWVVPYVWIYVIVCVCITALNQLTCLPYSITLMLATILAWNWQTLFPSNQNVTRIAMQ